MKLIVKTSLALTAEERDTLNKAAVVLANINKADINEDLADTLIGYREIATFDELSDLIYKITASAKDE